MEESDTDETPSPEPRINEKSQVSKPSAKTPTNLLAEIQEEMRISSQLRAHSTFVPEMHDHMAMEEFNASAIQSEAPEKPEPEISQSENQISEKRKSEAESDLDDNHSLSSDMATIDIDKTDFHNNGYSEG